MKVQSQVQAQSDHAMKDAVVATVAVVADPLRDHRVAARRLAPADPPQEEERDTEPHLGEGRRRRDHRGADGEPQVRPLRREGRGDHQPVGRQQGLGL